MHSLQDTKKNSIWEDCKLADKLFSRDVYKSLYFSVVHAAEKLSANLQLSQLSAVLGFFVFPVS